MIYFMLVTSVSNQAPHNLASSIHIPSLINSHLLCPSPLLSAQKAFAKLHPAPPSGRARSQLPGNPPRGPQAAALISSPQLPGLRQPLAYTFPVHLTPCVCSEFSPEKPTSF